MEGSRHSFATPCDGLADTLVNYRGADGNVQGDSSGLSLDVVSATDPMHVSDPHLKDEKSVLTLSTVNIGSSG